MPRNMVCISLFTAMAATGALPRTALASCSGNTCTFGQFGKVTYLAAKQSIVAPLLTKVDTSYTSAYSSYSQAMDLFKELKSLTSKFGTKEQIAAEALARRAKDPSGTLKITANIAAGFGGQLEAVKDSTISAQNHLANAKKNLQLADRDLQNVLDAVRLSKLRATESLDIFGAASKAGEVVMAIGTGEISVEVVKSVLGTGAELIGSFHRANLQQKIDDLQTVVNDASVKIGKDKLALAATELTQAQADLTKHEKRLRDAQTIYDNAVKNRDEAYNKGDAPKYGRPDDLSKADERAGNLTRLLKQAYADAYTVQMTIDKLEKSGDWMAPPQSESVQTLRALKNRADFIFKDCVNQRPIIESVQKLIQEAYAAANSSLNSKQ